LSVSSERRWRGEGGFFYLFVFSVEEVEGDDVCGSVCERIGVVVVLVCDERDDFLDGGEGVGAVFVWSG